MKQIIPFVLLLSNIAFGQQNLSPNKEYYDELEDNFNDITFNVRDMCDEASWLMLSYLNMYETTGDKAYLVKFINISVNAMINRQDIANNNFGSFSPYPPKWTLAGVPSGGEPTYYNTLYDQARFRSHWYLRKSNP